MKSFLSHYQVFAYLFLCGVITIASTTTTPPTFVTTMASTFETGSLILSTSSPVISGSFSSLTQTMTFLNSYSSSPSIGYGLSYLNSNWNTTTQAI